MPFEDAGLYMSVPNAIVIDSCDYVQTYALTKKLAAEPELSYQRLIRKGFKTVYADGSDFEIGKGVTLKDGKDVTLIASGIMVDEALKAEEVLSQKGISVRLIDMHTWKPLDEELIVKAAKETGCIVSCENHQVGTGLGAAIASVVAKNCPVPMEMVGIQNRFGQVGRSELPDERIQSLLRGHRGRCRKGAGAEINSQIFDLHVINRRRLFASSC